MKLNKFISLLFICLAVLVFINCEKKKTPAGENEENSSFDRAAMLSNYADNLIVPNYQSFATQLDSLNIAFDAFIQNKTITNLSTLRKKYIAADVKFQHISVFEFGPAEPEIIRSNFNSYPTNTVQVNSNIASGSYDLGTLSNLDAKGFPAMDYLFYGNQQSDQTIISLFDADAHAANRIAYVKKCLNEITTKNNTVLTAWKNVYRTTFISSTGSQIGSSLASLVNQLNFEIDLLKNGKIGIPLGKKSLDVKLPEKCESFYANNISVMLAKECLLNIEDIYLGRSVAGVDGKGLDDLLESVNAMHGTESLNSAIKNQFAIAKTKLNLVAEPLSASVNNSTAVVDAAYLEMVKLLVLLKTDTPSVLGIVITYQDGDGD